MEVDRVENWAKALRVTQVRFLLAGRDLVRESWFDSNLDFDGSRGLTAGKDQHLISGSSPNGMMLGDL